MFLTNKQRKLDKLLLFETCMKTLIGASLWIWMQIDFRENLHETS